MANEKDPKEELAEIEDVNIEPISDEDLDSVAGGAAGCTNCSGTGCCTSEPGVEGGEFDA